LKSLVGDEGAVLTVTIEFRNSTSSNPVITETRETHEWIGKDRNERHANARFHRFAIKSEGDPGRVKDEPLS